MAYLPVPAASNAAIPSCARFRRHPQQSTAEEGLLLSREGPRDGKMMRIWSHGEFCSEILFIIRL